MQEKLQALIERYGRSVSLSMEDGWHSPQFRALIQPLRYKNKMYLEGVHTRLASTTRAITSISALPHTM